MNNLHQDVDTYLDVRRTLGFKLVRTEPWLNSFVDYTQQQLAPFVTTTVALAWATLPKNGSPANWAKRLSAVRGFSKHLHASDPRHEVPGAELIPYRQTRKPPYIYSDEDVAALLLAAQGLAYPLMAATYTTLFGLLAVTGMRIGEALALDRADVDWNEAVLILRNTKFQKSREVALHPTTLDALRAYARKRDETWPRLKTPSFLVSLAGTRVISQNVNCTFLKLIQRAGLSERRPRRPRIHDLRHSFAVKTVRDWYKAGLEVEPLLPSLSTYLGHVSPSSTYWYLTATPELMSLAAERLERSLGELP